MSHSYEQIAEAFRRHDESLSEHDERVQAAVSEANWYFNRVTQPQQAARAAILANLRGDYSPRAKRTRARANAAYDLSTMDAEKLRLRAFMDCMCRGEVSQETGDLFTLLLVADETKAICADLRKILEVV